MILHQKHFVINNFTLAILEEIIQLNSNFKSIFQQASFITAKWNLFARTLNAGLNYKATRNVLNTISVKNSKFTVFIALCSLQYHESLWYKESYTFCISFFKFIQIYDNRNNLNIQFKISVWI